MTYVQKKDWWKIHAFDTETLFKDSEPHAALCGLRVRFSGSVWYATKKEFRGKPCKKCMRKWRPLMVAQIIGEEKP